MILSEEQEQIRDVLRDFARDSFSVSEQQGLDSLALGDLTVWAESGPGAILAAVPGQGAPAGPRLNGLVGLIAMTPEFQRR